MAIKWKHFRLAFTILAALIFTPVIGQFFIALAYQKGLYRNPSARLTGVVAVIEHLVSQAWFHWVAGILIGFAVGAWVDAIFRVAPDASATGSMIERTALADEAEKIAQELAALVGEFKGRHDIAWDEDGLSARTASAEYGRLIPVRTRSADVEAKFTEKYGEKILARSWIIIAQSRKFIPLGHRDIFHLRSSIGIHQGLEAVQFFTKLAIDLRSGRPDIPMTAVRPLITAIPDPDP